MFFNISLPEFSDSSDIGNIEKIRGYLATLNDQLRYMMLNIDEDNLSESLSNTISSASASTTAINEKINNAEKKLSALSSYADKVNWLIKSDGSPDDFTLTDKAFSLLTKSFDLNGYTTLSALENEGKSVINGSNIMSKTVTPEKISAHSLESISDTLGGWKIYNNAIISISENGSIFLNSILSNDESWLKVLNKDGHVTFCIFKNGDCFFNGSFISDGSVTHDKLPTNSSLKIDLSGNPNGLSIGKEISLKNEDNICRLYVNTNGLLTVDSGEKSIPFSLALTKENDAYTLSLQDSSGNTVGTVPLQTNT